MAEQNNERPTTIGTRLEYYDETDGGEWKDIAGILEGFVIPGGEADEIEVTALDDTYEQIRQGVKRLSDVEFVVAFDIDLDSQDWLMSKHGTGDLETFRVVYSDEDETTQEFTAFVKNYNSQIDPNDALKLGVTLRMTGEPEFNPET